MAGQLFVVGLPIGNMQDVSARALSVLKSVNAILAEDTREVVKFYRILELPIPTQLISYRDQNHDRVIAQILERLNKGEDLALVSDRGTPTISDPGYLLVRDVANAGIEVVAIPGPSAVIAALSISGLPTGNFAFLGFLPRTSGKQVSELKEFAEQDITLVMYESPFRIGKLLESIVAAFGGEVEVALAHELTKAHEQVFRGSAANLLSEFQNKPLKGEWVVLVRV